MKILHCADIHLGSKMESSLPKDKSEERKIEVRTAFSRMVDYAVQNGVSVIMLAGDVFDSDRPLKKDKEYFYSVVRKNADIDFLYLRGNHDNLESYTETDLKNLKTFSDEWTAYEYGNVTIYGIEASAQNARSLYSSFRANADKINIVMLHGLATEQKSGREGKDEISLPMLRGKNIDYLALGHIHSRSRDKLDERGVYAYSGCLEGRGFDECGEKGFFVLDVGEKITSEFVKNSVRVVRRISADIGDTDGVYSAESKVKQSFGAVGKSDLVRLELTGDIAYDGEGLEREFEARFKDRCYFLTVRNRTVRKFDVRALEGDLSLRGEFIRTVLKSEEYSEEAKQRIISAGLKALGGREVDE